MKERLHTAEDRQECPPHLADEDVCPADVAPARRSTRRIFFMVLVMAAAGAVVYFTPIRDWLKDSSRIREELHALGPWSYPVGAAIMAVLIGCGVPRLAFCLLAGMLLGFWWGFALTTLSTIFGYYGVFLFAHWCGRDWVMQHWPKIHKWTSIIHEQGVAGVILVRQLPIHGTLINLCLGLSPVKHRHFLLGTALGIIPESIPVTLVGAGLVEGSWHGSARYIGLASVALVVVWLGCGYALKAIRASRSEALAAGEVGE